MSPEEISAMSEQNNTSFAHAFLPGLILGLIVGALAGALVPDMMSANKFKVDPDREYTPREREERPAVDAETQAIIDAAEEEAAEGTDDAVDAVEELIDDAENALPSSP